MDYNFSIEYVRGGENTVADALSHMLEEGGRGEGEERSKIFAAVLKISIDPKISEDIRVRYNSDAFCQRILKNLESFPTVKVEDGLIYIGSRLIVPRVGTLQEDLFWMAHDTLGHFGADKSYATL